MTDTVCDPLGGSSSAHISVFGTPPLSDDPTLVAETPPTVTAVTVFDVPERNDVQITISVAPEPTTCVHVGFAIAGCRTSDATASNVAATA